MTCKEIAEKNGLSYARVTASAKALGHELPRGKGKAFNATPAEAKEIVAKAKEKKNI